MRLLLNFSYFWVVISSYKILLYSPTIGHSHVKFFGKIGDILIDAGHDVTIYLPLMDPDVQTNGTNRARIIRHEVLEDASFWRNSAIKKDPFEVESNMMTGIQIKLFHKIFDDTCIGQLEQPQMLEQLKNEKFDVVMTEYYDLCAFGIIKILEIPAQIIVSAVGMTDQTANLFGIPIPRSYVPTMFGSLSDEMTYSERLTNLISTTVGIKFGLDIMRRQNAIFRRYYGPDFPCLFKLAQRTAVALMNSEALLEYARPISHKIVYVGGIAISEQKPLSKKMKHIVSGSKKGAVYMSFGSLANSTRLAHWKKVQLLDAMAQFPDYNFIWKYEKPEQHAELFSNYSNVFPIKWAPQIDLLHDNRVHLFITHGGLNSVTEAVHSGTPMLAIPLFADQEHNVAMMVSRGVGINIDKTTLGYNSLKNALHEMLDDKRYEKKAKRLMAMLEKKLVQPRELIVKWTEFAAEFQDLSQMDLAGRDFTALKYYNLDIYLPIFCVFICIIYGCFALFRFALNKIQNAIKIKQKLS